MMVPLDTTAFDSAPISPEQRLWLGVILNAVMEAAGKARTVDRSPKREQIAKAARAWFENAGDDFQMVCTLGGLDPHSVRTGVIDYLRRVESDPATAIDMRRTRQPNGSTGNVTMADVADRAQVCRTTVVRALKGNPNVGRATRQRIIEAAHSVGYLQTQGHSHAN